METLGVGTIVAKNYLPFARVLAESLRRHHPDIPFFVVLADEVDGYFESTAESFSVLTLRDLAIPQLERFCFQNSRQQLITAAKPYLLSYLLNQGFASAVFFDGDILVLGNLDPLFAVVQRQAIIMSPHLLAPLKGPGREARELNILLSGTYNGGFLGVSDTSSSRLFLAWWEDRLYEHCRHAVERGMHYDQHWLDLVPVYFDGVHILRDPTYNVAYWSLPERNAHLPENLSPADTQACRFFHFSGFDPEQPPAVTRYSPRLTMGNVGPAVSLFDHYATLLTAAGYHTAKNWPYAYGCFDNGVSIPSVVRELYQALGGAAERFGNPRYAGGTDSYFHWLNEPIDSRPDPALTLTQLWRAVYEQRHDLQVAFPDPQGVNRRDFVKWAAAFGVKELSIPGSFVPSGWEA